MQSCYRVNPVHNVVNHAINRAQTYFSKRFAMTRHPARPPLTGTHPGASVSPSVAIEDWDALFTAVKARLTLAAHPRDGSTPKPTMSDTAQMERLCATVLDCVAALDQLHTTARDELMKRGSLKG